MTKRLGLLTSGGDCGGLNAVIRAVTRHAAGTYGWEVLGIRDGTIGLLCRPPDVEPLDPERLDAAMMRLGGTILGTTNKRDPFAFPMPDGRIADRSAEMIEAYHALALDALIGIGGDGSFAILRRLALKGGIPFVGIPKTIDNDVRGTETSIGYDTAVWVATEALDRLQPTAASHDRVMVLEVMGRDAGHIAIAAGIAGGADIVLIPEIPYRLERVAAHVDTLRRQGRNFALVIAAESVKSPDGHSVYRQHPGGGKSYGGIGAVLADAIARMTGAETRVTVLGHVQRGGQPTPWDRLLASAFGVAAVDLVAAGRFDRMVAWQNRRVVDVPLEEATSGPHLVDPEGPRVRTARGLGICLGDG
jgi:ATP-dependent phosphofructokinase / diphosphate-dependent phosphofructokinase